MNDTIRQAEACRQSADDVRRIAEKAPSTHEREAFRRLANGYDVLASQLENIVDRPGKRSEDLAKAK